MTTRIIIPRSRGTRKTRWSVRLAEVVARYLITMGGIGTIVAVVGVFLFLLYVVSPLFRAAKVEPEPPIEADWASKSALHLGLDEDQLMCWAFLSDGSLRLVRADTGALLEKRELFDEAKPTAVAFPPAEEAAFGFADGSVRMGHISFSSRFVADTEPLPAAAARLQPGQAMPYQEGMVLRTQKNQLRLQKLAVEVADPPRGPKMPQTPIVLIASSKQTKDQSVATLTEPDQFLATLAADGKLRLYVIKLRKSLEGDELIRTVSKRVELPYAPQKDRVPRWLHLSAIGDQVYLFWEDGHMERFDVRDRAKPVLAETKPLLKGDRLLRVTDVKPLLGRSTFLVGDTGGNVKAWFLTPAATGERLVMECGHDFPGDGAAVATIAVSARSRTAAIGYASGKIRLVQVTSERHIAELDSGNGDAMKLALAPKDDGVIVAAGNALQRWHIDPGHPDVSVKVLFGKVWYEGYEKPEFTWKTDSAEPKFSLVPLIFGTLKASFYSLLFALPIALLAAVYSSEYLHPRTKTVIKPSIELMASLPSVVLGFLAGLVFAQFVERVVSSVLAAIFTVPLAFVLGAYLWQLLPGQLSQVLSRWRFLFIVLVLPLGLLAAMPLGPWMEQTMFDGDLRNWLYQRDGSPVGGWVVVLLPLSALACVLWMTKVITPFLRARTLGAPRSTIALLDLAKFLAGCLLTVGLAWVAGVVLSWLGLDPRGAPDPASAALADGPDGKTWFGILGPYSQRNALVVGLMVGFAIIPIIYTIAEDALSSVPEHLRAGSLAIGATRWQTAMRIVIPTAMSGLFSAVMIGLGRAIGETMVMLMAAGNTPIMDMSLFDGFRTLSANIATELADAEQNSTHYRVLFLSALTLFALTFTLNTAAEAVRQRFRRRAYQL